MAINRATSSSVIATSTACRHLAMTPLLVQSQTRNPPTYLQFHGCRFHGIDRLVTLMTSLSAAPRFALQLVETGRGLLYLGGKIRHLLNLADLDDLIVRCRAALGPGDCLFPRLHVHLPVPPHPFLDPTHLTTHHQR